MITNIGWNPSGESGSVIVAGSIEYTHGIKCVSVAADRRLVFEDRSELRSPAPKANVADFPECVLCTQRLAAERTYQLAFARRAEAIAPIALAASVTLSTQRHDRAVNPDQNALHCP